MATYYPKLAARALRQADDLPEMYGNLDFTATPERFTTDPAAKSALPPRRGNRAAYLDDARLVELMRTALYLGDVPADRVAALSRDLSVTELIGLIRRACREGIENVPEAPPELAGLLAVMEEKPDWIDHDLIERGAARSRLITGLIAPFVTRGAFIATFTNSYAALPMTLTGALSGRRAAYRVNETTAFFTVTTLPGALVRFGPGFEAAVMVRVMHSMVRYNALTRGSGRSGRAWDAAVYGLPIPQLDQLPAGMIGPYLVSRGALRAGRGFTDDERAMIEFYRYRCFLLGLPEELLPADPQDIVDMFHVRGAPLRDGFDDSCRSLVTSTMDAYLRPTDRLFDRMADSVEKSYSKAAFCGAFCDFNPRTAKRMGVNIGIGDLARIAATGPFIGGRLVTVAAAGRLPALQKVSSRYLTRQVRHRLDVYGIPEYTTDHRHYAH
jgi:hypothetical protein